MGTVKELTAVFCAACVMCGALSLLAGKTLEKSFKYVLALILLSVTVTSVMNTDFSFGLPSVEASASVSENTLALSEYQAEYLCEAALNEAGIKFERISATASKSEEGGIVISVIEIKGAQNGEAAKSVILGTGITDTVKVK